MCFVILNLSRSYYAKKVPGLDHKRGPAPSVLSLYSFGVGTNITGAGARIPFSIVEIFCWSLAGCSEWGCSPLV